MLRPAAGATGSLDGDVDVIAERLFAVGHEDAEIGVAGEIVIRLPDGIETDRVVDLVTATGAFAVRPVLEGEELGPAALESGDVVDAQPVEHGDRWFVEVEPSARGLDGLNEIAEACFVMDPAVCPLGTAAFVLDGEVLSTPRFESPHYDDGTTIVIEPDDGFAERQALELAAIVAHGPLPVPLELESVGGD